MKRRKLKNHDHTLNRRWTRKYQRTSPYNRGNHLWAMYAVPEYRIRKTALSYEILKRLYPPRSISVSFLAGALNLGGFL